MSTVFARGSASIAVDDLELEARLVFTPDRKGETWTPTILDKFIRSNRLPALPPRALENFLEQAVGSGKPLELVLCRGQAPEAPVPEKISWISNPVPEEIEPAAREVLGSAPPPELYRTHTKRVRRERQVRKPGSRNQMETETYWEEEVIAEKAEVDPEVLKINYAEKGKAAGILSPAKPGKSGKNIYGAMLRPGDMPEGGILFGTGLEQHRTEIVPVITGILRIGNGWADVVPMPEPAWAIELGGDGVSLFLSYQPGHPHYPRPSPREILESLDAPEEGFVLVSAPELDAVLEKSTRSGRAIDRYPLCRRVSGTVS